MIMTTYKRNSNEIWLRNVQLGSSAKYICVAVSAAGNSEQQVTVTGKCIDSFCSTDTTKCLAKFIHFLKQNRITSIQQLVPSSRFSALKY